MMNSSSGKKPAGTEKKGAFRKGVTVYLIAFYGLDFKTHWAWWLIFYLRSQLTPFEAFLARSPWDVATLAAEFATHFDDDQERRDVSPALSAAIKTGVGL